MKLYWGCRCSNWSETEVLRTIHLRSRMPGPNGHGGKQVAAIGGSRPDEHADGVVPTRCLQLQVLLYGIIGGVLAARAGRNPRSRSLALSANRRVPHHRHE